jgi:hypothetical protein
MRQRPLWTVEPPLSTVERMSVNDPLRTTTFYRSGHTRIAASGYPQSETLGHPFVDFVSLDEGWYPNVLGVITRANARRRIPQRPSSWTAAGVGLDSKDKTRGT